MKTLLLVSLFIADLVAHYLLSMLHVSYHKFVQYEVIITVTCKPNSVVTWSTYKPSTDSVSLPPKLRRYLHHPRQSDQQTLSDSVVLPEATAAQIATEFIYFDW